METELQSDNGEVEVVENLPATTGYLEGLEPQSDPELVALAEKLETLRTQRIRLQGRENDTADALIAMMKHKGLKTYHENDLIVQVDCKEKVKVKRESGQE